MIFSSVVIPKGFTDLVTDSKGNSLPNKENKPLFSAYIPYVKDISEKLKHIRNHYDIRTIFKTKHILRNSHMRARFKINLQLTTHYMYIIPHVCGRSYFGKTGSSLAVQLCEHRHNLRENLLEKSKLAQHAYEEGHRVGGDEAMILEI
jgi:hypothetical protein